MAREDRAVERVAAAQRGAFSRSQAAECGFSRQMIEWRVRTAAWVHTRFAGVYRLAAVTPSWHQDLWAAVLWAGPGAALCGRSAAALYGLDRCAPGPIELLLPPNSKHVAPRGVVVRRSEFLIRARQIDGLPVTDPETTLLGVARSVRIDVLDDVLESAYDDGLTTPEKLALAIGRRAGSGPIRRILEGRVPGRPRQRRLEGEFSRMCRAEGIELERQVEVRVKGQRFFLDFRIRGTRVAAELDGFGKLRTKAGKEAFLERATKLGLIGWTILHFSWYDVMHRPDYVIQTILEAVALAEIG